MRPTPLILAVIAATFWINAATTTAAGAAGRKEEAPRGKVMVYKKTPQGELSIELFYPPGWKATDKRVGIVFFFGGGWTGGSRSQFYPQCEYLASRGMVAATADYRIFSKHKTTPDKCVEDGKSAVRWMRQHAAELGIDPDKLAAGGGSAGGHVAACAATVPGLDGDGEVAAVSSRPVALVLFNPVMRFPEQFGKNIPGDEAARAKFMKQISPNEYVAKETAPAILFFGTEDRLIDSAQEFLKLSAKAGNRAEMYLAQGQKHGFFNRPPWTEATLRQADQFLASLKLLEGEPKVAVPAGAELKRSE